jgi:hypothetical protein
MVCSFGMEDELILSEFVSETNLKMSSSKQDNSENLNIKIFSGNQKYDTM